MDRFEIKNNKAIYNGVGYDFDKLPENVVFDGNIIIKRKNLSRLPNMSSWVITGGLDCSYNYLTSLIGCPKKLGNSFICFSNNLTSLKYCPVEIPGNFYCYYNKLQSLKYCPKRIDGEFDCSCNYIEEIDSWPEFIGGDLLYHNNPIKLIKEGVMPLKYLIEFYKKGIGNAKELLMKEFGCDNEDETNAYLLMIGEI